jgi:hypothetical protein
VSTILRALQRVEGEKSGDGEMGALREGVVPPGEPLVREGKGRWRIGLAVSLAGLVLGFFLWWMIPGEEVTQPSARLPAEAAPPSAAPSARPEHPPREPREFEVAAARPTAPAERVRSSPPPQAVAAPPPRHLVEEQPPRVPVAEAPTRVAAEPPAAPERTAAAPPIPPPIEKPAPQERIAELPPPAAAPPPPAAKPATQPPPQLAEPPAPAPPAPARVAKIRPPKVTVKKTIWHPTPERRVARIEVEGRKGPLELHEGDAVGTLVVAEIQPSGVVFLHGGEKLRRKVSTAR